MNMMRLMWRSTMWLCVVASIAACALALAASWEDTFVFMSLLLGQIGIVFALFGIVAAIKDVSS